MYLGYYEYWVKLSLSLEEKIVILARVPGWVNLAGKVKNLFLVTIDVYRLENRKI